MKKLNEIFSVESGIFNIFQSNFAALYTALFSTTTPAELNIFALLRHGNKYATDYLATAREEGNTYVTNLINSIIACYANSWQALAAGINVEASYSGTTVKTKSGTLTREIDTANNDTTFERVFNDTTPQNTATQQSTNNGTTEDTYDLTETETKQMNADDINQLMQLKRQNLFVTIIDDICSEITIRIY